jgi:hypothetical protein
MHAGAKSKMHRFFASLRMIDIEFDFRIHIA